MVLFKKINLVSILLIILLLVSCSSNSGNQQATYNFKQGIGQLNIKFLDNAPPNKIYPQNQFKIIAELDNQQAYDIVGGQVRIVGLDEKYFGVFPLEESFDTLMGKSLVSPAGDKIFMEFTGESGLLFQNAQSYSNTFFLKVKYDSKVEFSDAVCINPNLYEVYDSGCKRQDRKSYSGQGAPLAVTRLEQVTFPAGTGANVEFRLDVENRGNGKAGFVNLIGSKLGGKEINCVFQGKGVIDEHRVEFKDKQQKSTLICKVFLKDQSSYETTLTTEFIYDYELKKQQRLNLVK